MFENDCPYVTQLQEMLAAAESRVNSANVEYTAARSESLPLLHAARVNGFGGKSSVPSDITGNAAARLADGITSAEAAAALKNVRKAEKERGEIVAVIAGVNVWWACLSDRGRAAVIAVGCTTSDSVQKRYCELTGENEHEVHLKSVLKLQKIARNNLLEIIGNSEKFKFMC